MAAMNWRRVAHEAQAQRYGVERAVPTRRTPEKGGVATRTPPRKAAAKPKGDRLKLEAQRQDVVAKLRALREDRERQRAEWDALGL